MKEGLLWYDDNPKRDLAQKVALAAARYYKKHGHLPNLCLVHPSALSGNGKVQKVGRVRVVSQTSVLRHHFWIGVTNE